MAIESANPPHRAAYPNITSSGDASNEVERSRLAKFPWADNRGPLFDNTPLQTWFDAVECQRMNVVNVLAIVQSMSVSFKDSTCNPAPEISAAFDLLEQEIQRIVAALEKAALFDPQ